MPYPSLFFARLQVHLFTHLFLKVLWYLLLAGVMANVKQCAAAIAQNTNQLIAVANVVSSKSTNDDLQNGIFI